MRTPLFTALGLLLALNLSVAAYQRQAPKAAAPISRPVRRVSPTSEAARILRGMGRPHYISDGEGIHLCIPALSAGEGYCPIHHPRPVPRRPTHVVGIIQSPRPFAPSSIDHE